MEAQHEHIYDWNRIKKVAPLSQKKFELLDETLAKKDHRWFVNQMDPGEAAARQKAAEEFKQRLTEEDGRLWVRLFRLLDKWDREAKRDDCPGSD